MSSNTLKRLEEKTTRVLALDLEGTLISNAMSQFVRPGLYAFLETCFERFAHVVLFTAVGKSRAMGILTQLVREGCVPEQTATMRYVDWDGEHKDLRFVQQFFSEVPLSDIFLVDDLEAYVMPGQRDQWVPIQSWASPYSLDDQELIRLQRKFLDSQKT